MARRPELKAPPEIFYDDTEVELSERALELFALPYDGVPRLLLDIDIAVGQEVEGDLLHGDMVQARGSGLSLDHYIDAWQEEPELYSRYIPKQLELILSAAMLAGFAGGVVIDYPHGFKSRKEFLVLTCGPPSLRSDLPKGKVDDMESSHDEISGDEENQTIGTDPGKNNKGKGREWVLKKKEQTRRKGNVGPPDTKYTVQKRKAHF